jgi:hypothetical protein
MSGRRIAILVALLVVCCCVISALGLLAYRIFVPTAEAAEAPNVVIERPSHGEEVVVGDDLQVFATGTDPAKITHMELWADGALVESQRSALSEGTSPFPLVGKWTPRTPGNHTLVVRAYNTAGVSGQASVSVNAVEGPTLATEMPAEGCEGVPLLDHAVQEGETLDGIAAGYGVTVEQILACNPGLDPAALAPGDTLHIPHIVSPDEEGTPAEDETPPDAEVGPEEPEGADEVPGEELPPEDEAAPEDEEPPADVEEGEEVPEEAEPELPPPAIALEFEAWELEVDQEYFGLYCNVSLADSDVEMIPYMNTFTDLGSNYWDIAAELGDENSRMVPLATDTLRVFAECFGFTSDVEVVSLGSFTREHPSADWTGDPIEVVSEGGEDGRWFRVVYRICPFPCEPRPVPDPPILAYYHFDIPPWFHWHIMAWDWTGDESTIDGFRLYRNGAMFQEIPDPTARGMLIGASDAHPPCGESYEYNLTAYQGFPGVGPESDPSNTVLREGPPCPKTVTVTFEELNTGCILADCPPSPPDCDTCDVDIWYGNIYANGEEIEVEKPSFWDLLLGWDVPDIDSHSIHSISDLFGDDTVTLELDPADNLTVGISIEDWDFGPDDTLCEGAWTVPSALLAPGASFSWWLSCEGDPPQAGEGILSFSVDVAP